MRKAIKQIYKVCKEFRDNNERGETTLSMDILDVDDEDNIRVELSVCVVNGDYVVKADLVILSEGEHLDFIQTLVTKGRNFRYEKQGRLTTKEQNFKSFSLKRGFGSQFKPVINGLVWGVE